VRQGGFAQIAQCGLAQRVSEALLKTRTCWVREGKSISTPKQKEQGAEGPGLCVSDITVRAPIVPPPQRCRNWIQLREPTGIKPSRGKVREGADSPVDRSPKLLYWPDDRATRHPDSKQLIAGGKKSADRRGENLRATLCQVFAPALVARTREKEVKGKKSEREGKGKGKKGRPAGRWLAYSEIQEDA